VFQKDPAVLGIFAILIILGSISYVVLADVFRYRKFRLFTLNTKLVLVVVGFLCVFGTLVIFLAEYTNPDTLGPMALGHKAMNAFFLSISGRTAGFVTIGFGTMRQHTDFFIIGLMFIGGASGSTAGGIKVNTFAIILVTLVATMRGRNYSTAFGREIPQAQAHRALLVGALAAAFVFLVAFLMAFSEPQIPFVQLLFESVSAFGTVGMTTGKTGILSTWGQLILVITMYVGRIGPLTLALMMARRERGDVYRYAKERVTIG
jgi:trk system potassium uptake protein TrkH